MTLATFSNGFSLHRLHNAAGHIPVHIFGLGEITYTLTWNTDTGEWQFPAGTPQDIVDLEAAINIEIEKFDF